jgi:tetratricopeptide (TPR) repeat protein
LVDKEKAPQEVKESELFRYAAFFVRHKWRIAGAAALIAAVLVVIGLVQASQKRSIERAFQARLTSETPKELQQVGKDFPRTFDGSVSLIEAGNLLFKEGKFADARKLYLKFLEDYRDSRFRSWVYNLMGATFEAEAKYDEAIRYYRRAEASPWVRMQAKLNIGRCYEQKGDFERARTYYRQLTETAPSAPGTPPAQTSWRREAQERMNFLREKERKSEKRVDKENQ